MALHVSQCDGCGAVDDHPKHHYGDETYHHDCTPHRIIEDMTSVTEYGQDETGARVQLSRTPIDPSNYPEHTKRFLKLRDLAQKGTRGEQLRAKALALKPVKEG